MLLEELLLEHKITALEKANYLQKKNEKSEILETDKNLNSFNSNLDLSKTFK